MTTTIRGQDLKLGSLYDHNDPRVRNPEGRVVVVIQQSKG